MKENDLLARFSSAQKTLEVRAAMMPGPSDGPFAGREVLAGVRLCIRASENNLCPETILPTAELKKSLSIADFNLGTTVLDDCELVRGYSQLQDLLSYSCAMIQTTLMGFESAMRISGGMVTGKVGNEKLPLLIGTAAKEMQKTCMDWLKDNTEPPSRLRIPVYKDWAINRENIGQKDSSGFVKVSGLRIDRVQYRTNETGEEKMDAPWLIKVYTFDAPANASGYDPTGVKSMKKEHLALTDSQMFSLCERVIRIDEAYLRLELEKE